MYYLAPLCHGLLLEKEKNTLLFASFVMQTIASCRFIFLLEKNSVYVIAFQSFPEWHQAILSFLCKNRINQRDFLKSNFVDRF